MTATRRRTRIAPESTVVAYTRVSTDEQATSGAGLDAQRIAIEAEAQRRGWTVVGLGISVISPHHFTFGAAAVKSRCSRSGNFAVAARLCHRLNPPRRP